MLSVATTHLTVEWTELLSSEGIEYVERGANVARGHINIHCPWCGPADPSHHLGIALDGRGWGCWRDPAHRGRSPKRLLYKLLGDRAAKYFPQQSPEELLSTPELGSRFSTPPRVEPQYVDTEAWDKGFKFTRRLTSEESQFREYLEKERHLQIATCVRKGLRVAQYGHMAWRVFCPIRWQHQLQGYTARSIGHASPRYLVGPGKIDTLNTIRDPFLDAPVVLLEGYFDALRLWECSVGKEFGIVVLHGTALSTTKINQLKSLSEQHPLVFALDDDAQHLAMKYSLAFDGYAVPPPTGRKDLGESSTPEIEAWIHKLSTSF